MTGMAIVCGVLLWAAAAGAATGAGGPAVAIEGGVGLPLAGLGDDFNATDEGFGAGAALELGFQWRQPLAKQLVLAPTFRFLNHRDLLGEHPEAGEYRVQSSTLFYGLELLWSGGTDPRRPAVLLGAAAGWARNRTQGPTKDFAGTFDESVNTLGLSVRAGLSWRGLEGSVAYNHNRFESWRYFAGDTIQEADWDTVVFRFGWVVPLEKKKVIRMQ